ncbi:MAG: hypothetical protein ACK6D2_03260 [Planctomycetota bacterium]
MNFLRATSSGCSAIACCHSARSAAASGSRPFSVAASIACSEGSVTMNDPASELPSPDSARSTSKTTIRTSVQPHAGS